MYQQSHLDQWRYCWLYQTQHKIYPQLNWQKSTHNQIIQAIAVDIACTGD
ncbi:hypothetical protein BAZSYMA_ACONTIG77493_0 [Bathymodiolus azoricus thioautotrophic gill symbiont]|uniref:Uncharacterized protein n=1 Tax=Bathymodiolus azoricus thioautotrophic gill symbiont TaxID=235205 RepID=A0A1H6K7Z6_9GAMM|nr:hypothetical protein BAZSYMA_ACONTIG77493_0 [Bathymodiolus azoricus thioautotrophic gill symbiont]